MNLTDQFIQYFDNETDREFALLIKRLRPGFIATANNILKTERYEAKADIVNDTFADIWIKRDKIKNVPPGARSTYVYTMLKNNCKLLIRTNAARYRMIERLKLETNSYTDEFNTEGTNEIEDRAVVAEELFSRIFDLAMEWYKTGAPTSTRLATVKVFIEYWEGERKEKVQDLCDKHTIKGTTYKVLAVGLRKYIAKTFAI